VGQNNGDAEESHVPMKSEKSNKYVIAVILNSITVYGKII
jgi:hypothetical protein